MKSKFVLLIVVYIAGCFCIRAQPCLPGGLHITNQAQIDNFATQFPGCNEILGNLTIYPNPLNWTNDITNLHGLNAIQSVVGNVFISGNPFLTKLDGLENLKEIGQWLWIWNNDVLTSLESFKGLEKIGGNLRIESNPVLENVDGFEKISELFSLRIENNPMMYNLDGFNNLATVEYLNISGMPMIEDMRGFINLKEVKRDINLSSNSTLKSLDGLDSLGYIGGSLIIGKNDELRSLTGLDNLASFGPMADSSSYFPEGVYIDSNEKLADISSFRQLKKIEGNLHIAKNHSLKNLDGLDSIIYVGAEVRIIENDSLENITGLSALNKIGHIHEFENSLEIRKNPKLKDLKGLKSLDLVVGNVMIIENKSIKSLEGLAKLSNIEGSLSIIHCDSLKELSGFPDQITIGNSLYISNNMALHDLDGLQGLTFVGGDMSISSNGSLSSLEGLQNVAGINGELTIQQNSSLQTLEALSSLLSINGTLRIAFNDLLPELAGIDNIDPGSITSLFLFRNLNLSICGVESICEYLKLLKPAQIHNNADGCSSRQQVNNSCIKQCSIRVVIVAAKDSICINESAVLNAVISDGKEPFSYIWNTGETNNWIEVSPTENKPYSVTVTDSESCSDSTIMLIEVMDNPVVEFILSGNTIILEIAGGKAPYNILWSTGETSAQITPASDGIYHVTVTDYNGCIYIGQYNFVLDNTEDLTENDILIFPNPGHKFVLVYFPESWGKAKISIKDIWGRTIYRSFDAKQTIRLAVENWPDGIYFISVQAEHKIYNALFLKQ